MFVLKQLKSNIDLTLAVIFAVVTGMFAPPSLFEIAERLNLPLLLLLIFLMCIVAGLRVVGFFSVAFEKFFHGYVKSGTLCRFFIFSCYFSSMLITNDVALIVFVPLAISTLTELRRIRLIAPTVVWQTIAANLGSMLTPIGNPQNLFIYSRYNLNINEFLTITAPFVVLGGVLIYIGSRSIQNIRLKLSKRREKILPWRKISFLVALFALCLLHILHIIDFLLLAIIVLPAIYFIDKKLFLLADYKLIFLFAALFVGVGNLSHIPFFQNIPRYVLGNEFIISLLLSQIISNVPATVLLAEFTNEYSPLLLGVNVGGLGTLIASMASVISFKAYVESRFCNPIRYLVVFTLYNIATLAILLLYYYFSVKFYNVLV